MLAKQDVNGLNKLNASIEQEKKSIIDKADWDARQDREAKLKESKTTGKGARQTTTTTEKDAEGTGTNSIKYQGPAQAHRRDRSPEEGQLGPN
ncbi:MAG: hypothetical protein QM755_05375 [Luteolibacter sp.]